MCIRDRQYTEPSDAFHELYNDLKNEKMKNKVLSKENKRLIKENIFYDSQISSINSQKDNFEKVISSLKKDNENFIKENILLKKEIVSLNERIFVLDKDINFQNEV